MNKEIKRLLRRLWSYRLWGAGLALCALMVLASFSSQHLMPATQHVIAVDSTPMTASDISSVTPAEMETDPPAAESGAEPTTSPPEEGPDMQDMSPAPPTEEEQVTVAAPTVIEANRPIREIPSATPAVYLTIDDGPTHWLPDIVEVLTEKQAPATFFWIGIYDPPQPEIIQRMLEAGLQFGTHTLEHHHLAGKPASFQKYQILAGLERIKNWVAPAPVPYMRPPAGSWDDTTQEIVTSLGLVQVLWNVDPKDWHPEATAEGILSHVLSSLRPGAIILLHEKPVTLKVLPELIDRIRAAGYEILPLPELEIGPNGNPLLVLS